MLQDEKNLRGKLEGLDLKGDQVDNIINQILEPKKQEVKDETITHANNLLSLEAQIQQTKDPMEKARLVAAKMSYKIDNYQY